MRKALIVLLVFMLLTIGLTWPLILHAASAVEDVHDALLDTWILAWDGRQLLTDPLHLFDANIFYPYQNTLAFSEIILPQALIALPFSLVTGNPILGYNIALLTSFVLSGFCTYLLVLRMTRSRWAGVAAGVIFAFNAYKMSNLAQVQLLALQWLPLALLYLTRTLEPPAGIGSQPVQKAPQWRNAALLAIFVVLQALSSFYYAILSALAIALALAVLVIVRRRYVKASGLFRALASLAAAVLIVLPFVLPYLHVERDLGFRRAIQESEPFSASLAQYAQAVPGNQLYGALVEQSPQIVGGYPLDALFPGALTLLLALVGIVGWRRKAGLWVFPFVLVLLAFVLSLGPALTLSPGHRLSLPLAMPYRLLYALPGLQALRAPVRFASLVFMGLSILAGLGVAAIARSPAPRRGEGKDEWRSPLAVLLTAVLVVECVTLPAAHIAPVPTGSEVPAVYRWLAQQEPGVVLELPMMATTPERGLLNQYFSVFHWRQTPDGYSGFIPPKHGEIAYEMQFFPSERSVSMLRGLDVRYLVVHTDLISDWQQRASLISGFGAEITGLQNFGNITVFRVSEAPTEEGLHGSIYLPQSAQSGQDYTASLILTNTASRSFITKPTASAQVEVVWRGADNAPVKTERLSVAAPIAISEAAVVPITVQTPAGGAYTISIKVRLPQGTEVSESGSVTIRKVATPLAQVIPVRLASGLVEQDRYHPGDTVSVKLRWRALGKIDAYYSVFVRLLDKNGEALVHVDGQPGQGAHPTLLWVPGTEIDDNWRLQLPATAPAGRYTLEAGIYRPDDLSSRLTLDGTGQPIERMFLGAVYIAPTLDVAGVPSLPVNAALGDKATLVGYDIEGCTWVEKQCQVRGGRTLVVTLYWRADNDMPVDYTVFVHLADATGKPRAQDDSQPRQGQYPTSVWQRGDVVADRHTLNISVDTPPAQYELLTGMYDLTAGTRIRTAIEGDAIPLVSVVVP